MFCQSASPRLNERTVSSIRLVTERALQSLILMSIAARSTSVDTRRLRDLAGVGPSIEADLHLLGVMSLEQLATREGDELYTALCEKTETRQDPCVLDTLRCAVAQARDPHLPVEQRNRWWWSRQRKQSNI